MVRVLELRVAVDPTLDPDEPPLARSSDADGLADRDEGRAREQPADAIPGTEAPQEGHPDGERGSAERDDELGGHGPE